MPTSSCTILEKTDLGKSPALAALMPRVVERILGRKQSTRPLIAGLFGVLLDAKGSIPTCRGSAWTR